MKLYHQAAIRNRPMQVQCWRCGNTFRFNSSSLSSDTCPRCQDELYNQRQKNQSESQSTSSAINIRGLEHEARQIRDVANTLVPAVDGIKRSIDEIHTTEKEINGSIGELSLELKQFTEKQINSHEELCNNLKLIHEDLVGLQRVMKLVAEVITEQTASFSHSPKQETEANGTS